jgi:hypothetical protein
MPWSGGGGGGGGAPSGAAGGDLNGTYPNPGVDDGADATAIHDNVAGEISALTAKGTAANGDFVIIEDSADSNNKKSMTLAVLVALASGGGGAAITKDIAQVGHGLAVGDVVKRASAAYSKAQADSAANAEVIGIVSAVTDVDNFTLLYAGEVTGLSGLTDNTVYFLSAATAGLLTATEPSTANQISKPVFLATSTTTGVFLNMRGTVIGGQSNPAALVISGERILTGATTYTVDASGTDYILLCDALLGAVTVTLPASPTAGRQIVLKDATGSATTANITIQQSAAETIDGATSVTLAVNYQSLTLRANADGNWSLI